MSLVQRVAYLKKSCELLAPKEQSFFDEFAQEFISLEMERAEGSEKKECCIVVEFGSDCASSSFR